MKEVLEKTGNIRCSFIYGSYAKKRENYFPNIDLVVIGDLDEDVLIRELDKLENILKIEYQL